MKTFAFRKSSRSAHEVPASGDDAWLRMRASLRAPTGAALQTLRAQLTAFDLTAAETAP